MIDTETPKMPQDEIVGHLVLDLSDVSSAIAENPQGPFVQRYFTIMAIGSVALPLLALAQGGGGAMSSYALSLLGAAFMGFGAWSMSSKNQAKRFLERKSAKELDTTYIFDAVGYRIESQASSSRAEWGTVHRFHEGKTVFLLYSDRSFQMVPKRALRTEDVARVRELLRANVTPPKGRVRNKWTPALVWSAIVLVFIVVYMSASPR